MVVQSQEEQWPSVEVAYGLVLPSYEWMLRRLEAAESRIHSLLMLAATVTLAIPIIVGALTEGKAMLNNWAFAVFAAFFVLAVVGLVARSYGSFSLPNLRARTGATSQSCWEFKKDSLYHAASSLDRNTKRVRYKARAADGMSALLAIEVLCGAVWVAGALG